MDREKIENTLFYLKKFISELKKIELTLSAILEDRVSEEEGKEIFVNQACGMLSTYLTLFGTIFDYFEDKDIDLQ